MKPSLWSLGALAALVPLAAQAAPAQERQGASAESPGLRRIAPGEEESKPRDESIAPDADPRGLLVGPFDPAAWRARLSTDDLDRRERVYDLLVARARLDPVARAWLEQLVRDPAAGELAWTARLALRELGRARFPLLGGRSADPLDPFGELERRMQELLARQPLLQGPGRRDGRAGTEARGSGRSVHVEQGVDGARVRVTETVDGVEVQRGEYTGRDLAEILRANPELEQELGGLRLDPGGRAAPRLEPLGPPGGPALAPQGLSRPFVTDKLGVNVEPLDAARARELGLSGVGLLVLRVVPQTYAHLLGVAAGDVLIELDGMPLRSGDDIGAAMRARDANDELLLVWVDRLGQRREKAWRP